MGSPGGTPLSSSVDIKQLDDTSRQFIVEDYKLKVQYLTDHFSRMWNRLSYFLTVELAVFGALGYFLFDSQGRDVRVAPAVAVLGGLTSIAWYVVGAQDRFLVTAYRDDLRGIANLLSAALVGMSWYGEHYVGSRSGGPLPFRPKIESQGLWSWYREEWSITHMPSILAFLLVIFWGFVGVASYCETWVFARHWK
jgi:hypothetical protein